MRSLSFAGIGVILVVIVALLVGWPSYNVYAARKHGEAELARASQNRQVRVQEALAKYEAADYDAKAEIRRAQGVAAANKIIAESPGGPEGYLRWRYIEMLQETSAQGGHQVIYIPTEAGLPILEAGRRAQPLPRPDADKKKD